MINGPAIMYKDGIKNSFSLNKDWPLSFTNVASEGSTGSLIIDSNSPTKKLENVSLSWRSLSVKVSNGIFCKNRKGRKIIFENADGVVKPGEMLALMGNLMIILYIKY